MKVLFVLLALSLYCSQSYSGPSSVERKVTYKFNQFITQCQSNAQKERGWFGSGEGLLAKCLTKKLNLVLQSHNRLLTEHFSGSLVEAMIHINRAAILQNEVLLEIDRFTEADTKQTQDNLLSSIQRYYADEARLGTP